MSSSIVQTQIKKIKQKETFGMTTPLVTTSDGKKMGKSFSEVSDLDLENGRIRVWCENWDRNFEESKYWNNHFSVSAASKEYLDWLDNEAY